MEPYPCPQYEPLPLTQDMVLTLMRAVASGRKEVAYGTKKIVYHNVADALKVLQWMQLQLNGRGSQGRITMEYDSGLTGNGRDGLYEAEEDYKRY